MARQASDIIIITGRMGNVVFYKMDNKGYARLVSSLTGEEFNTKACFKGSRKSAARFGAGNKIAGEVYDNIASETRKYPLYCLLKSKAIALLKQGIEPTEVKLILQEFVQCASQTPLMQ